MTYSTNATAIINMSRQRQKALNSLRGEIRSAVATIADPSIGFPVTRLEVFEKAAFRLGEVLRKYTFILSDAEVRDMAMSFTTEIRPSARERQRIAREKLRRETKNF